MSNVIPLNNLNSGPISTYEFREWLHLLDDVIEHDDPNNISNWLALKNSILHSAAQHGAVLDECGNSGYEFCITIEHKWAVALVDRLKYSKELIRDLQIRPFARKKKKQSLTFTLNTARHSCWVKSVMQKRLLNIVNHEEDN